MASTRISNDKIRINKYLQQSTDVGRHVMNVPGNGLNIPFINDPQVRMQLWGANRVNDIIGVENSLMCIDRPLTRECMKSQYTVPNMSKMDYSTESFDIMESNISQPAWNLRDKESERVQGFQDEQNDANLFIPFNTNLGTRMYEKDNFCRD
jgi:hypothetical protein